MRGLPFWRTGAAVALAALLSLVEAGPVMTAASSRAGNGPIGVSPRMRGSRPIS
jgi:hypothetical protein